MGYLSMISTEAQRENKRRNRGGGGERTLVTGHDDERYIRVCCLFRNEFELENGIPAEMVRMGGGETGEERQRKSAKVAHILAQRTCSICESTTVTCL